MHFVSAGNSGDILHIYPDLAGVELLFGALDYCTHMAYIRSALSFQYQY